MSKTYTTDTNAVAAVAAAVAATEAALTEADAAYHTARDAYKAARETYSAAVAAAYDQCSTAVAAVIFATEVK